MQNFLARATTVSCTDSVTFITSKWAIDFCFARYLFSRIGVPSLVYSTYAVWLEVCSQRGLTDAGHVPVLFALPSFVRMMVFPLEVCGTRHGNSSVGLLLPCFGFQPVQTAPTSLTHWHGPAANATRMVLVDHCRMNNKTRVPIAKAASGCLPTSSSF